MSMGDHGKQNLRKALKGNGLYYLMQEFNYNDKLVNHAKDRFTESISSIAIWFISKNIASGYATIWTVIYKNKCSRPGWERAHVSLRQKQERKSSMEIDEGEKCSRGCKTIGQRGNIGTV
jgi:hypothetical protein